VAVDLKIGFLAHFRQLAFRKANINIDYPMAIRANDVVMVRITTGSIHMTAIGKLNSIHQALVDQGFHRPEYRGSSQMRIQLLEILPERFTGEYVSAIGQIGEPRRDLSLGVGLPAALFHQRGPDFFSDFLRMI
jgi:hypothetical protein